DRPRQSPAVRRVRAVALWRGAQPPHVGAVPDLLSRAGDYRTEAEAGGAVPERADLRSPYLMSSLLEHDGLRLDRLFSTRSCCAAPRIRGVSASIVPTGLRERTHDCQGKFVMPKALIFHSGLALVWAMA